MVRRSVTLPVGPDRLWPVLTDPAQASRWLGGRIRWELRPGGALRFSSADGGDHRGRVDEVRPERLVRWTWWPEHDPSDASEVTWTLVPDGEGTELTVTEAPVARAMAQAATGHVRWSAHDEQLLAAWAAQLRLPAAVA